MNPSRQKTAGAYYTPDAVAECLLKWVIRHESDRMLDPSCGDGRFIRGHRNSVGIEQDLTAARHAIGRAPAALVHEGDFFAWAANTVERFECAAGNPPFIRYQTFKGAVRERALRLCSQAGAVFSGLSSSWAPFLVGAATLLKSGGRMAFVVPAEIGHAPYVRPLLEFLVTHFGVLHVIAIREKLFPDLSEDCWLLYAEGYGKRTDEIRFTALRSFAPMREPPRNFMRVSVDEWRDVWGCRLRPFIMSSDARDLYREVASDRRTHRFGDLATIGIGYVTGANGFFHLRPSQAERWGIPGQFLQPTVRNGRALPSRLTTATVEKWRRDDEQSFLLKLPKSGVLPACVRRYLDSEEGQDARTAYKCRVREPWYSVPDIRFPDFILSYMSGLEPSLVRNEANCSCTNSVHSVQLRTKDAEGPVTAAWLSPFARLSCEIEGHPLGGGMLKLEPREAGRIVLPAAATLARLRANDVVDDAVQTLRKWRHYEVAN
jgi:adenine-specific DNA-methyltransferase